MRRILLTCRDLVRLRFELDPRPLVDASQAARALRRPSVIPLAHWRSEVVRSLDARVHPLLALNPPTGTTCGFVQPPGMDLDSGLEQVRAVSVISVRAEIGDLDTPPTTWLRRLAEGDRTARAELVEATARMHAVAVAPLSTISRRSARRTWRAGPRSGERPASPR